MIELNFPLPSLLSFLQHGVRIEILNPLPASPKKNLHAYSIWSAKFVYDAQLSFGFRGGGGGRRA